MTDAPTRDERLARETLFTPRFFVMCGFTFTVFFSAFLLFPTAPFRILELGGSKLLAGLFLGCLTFGSALSAPFTGALADRIGKRRTLVVASLTLGGFTLAYGASTGVGLLLALVPLHGLFWSATLTASAAHLVGLVPEKRRAEGIAYWGLSTVAAIAVAPTIAFWIYERGGWSAVCWVAAGLNALMAAIAWRLEESAGEPAAPEPVGQGFLEWRVLFVSFTLLLFSFGYGGVTSFVALYAEANAAPKGLYFTALALVILVTRPLAGTLADRVGHKKVLVPALALTSVGLALLVPRGTPIWLVSSALVFGLGFGSAFPVYTAHVMRHVSSARRGAAFGSMLCAFDVGIGLGSTSLGYVIERAGYGTAFALAAGLAALSLPYFLLAERALVRERETGEDRGELVSDGASSRAVGASPGTAR